MIVSRGNRAAAVGVDEPGAAFAAASVVNRSLAAPVATADVAEAQATVEVMRRGGGMRPRALLGGQYTPAPTQGLRVEVGLVGEPSFDEATCPSQLWKPLVPGLPEEFIDAVVQGLAEGGLASGVLLVNRGAYDPVESSNVAFRFAGALLASVVAASSSGQPVEPVVMTLLDGWGA